MTENEALEILNNECEDISKVQIALKVAREALEKIIYLEECKTYELYREYLSIGTVEEFKALKEKSEPKKMVGLYGNICPSCSWVVSHNNKYCERCGQKLDWQCKEKIWN